MVQRMGGKAVEMFSDLKLVVGQVKGELETKYVRMQGYLNQVKHLQSGFESFNILHIPRSGNTHANSLAMLVTFLAQSLLRVILVEDLYKPMEGKRKMVHVHQVRVGPSWMDPIVLFLKNDILPKEKSEADKVQRKAPQFWLSKDQKLYKRSFFGLYLLCIHLEVSELLLEELHQGIYGSHIGGRSLSHRAITHGYWWLNMQKEAKKYVKKCDQCQRYAQKIHQLGGILNPLPSPLPFAQWGLDIVGLFPKVAGNKRYLLVGMDYFTKWVEAEPLANIRDVDTKKFVWKNIVTRFRVPRTLISDNGLQFDSKAFQRYYCDLGITNRYSTLKGKSVEEFSHVLWTYWTMPYRSTRETPFSMTYGTGAVILLETRFLTLRTSYFDPSNNDELLGQSLNFIKE